jgi:hypothetical protein
LKVDKIRWYGEDYEYLHATHSRLHQGIHIMPSTKYIIETLEDLTLLEANPTHTGTHLTEA